jgi:hypothetical protein
LAGLAVAAVALTLAGCGEVPHEPPHVDAQTAQHDIAELEREKAAMDTAAEQRVRTYVAELAAQDEAQKVNPSGVRNGFHLDADCTFGTMTPATLREIDLVKQCKRGRVTDWARFIN